MDVGHGNCTVIAGQGEVVVIDGGPGSAALEYLTREGIDRIATIVVSHADADHVRGLLALVSSAEFTIGRVRLNSDALKGSDLWEDLVYELDAKERAGQLKFDVSLVEGDAVDLDLPEVSIHVLGPRRRLAARGPGARDPDGRNITSNSISAVIRVDYLDEPIVLLTGDIDAVGLDHLLDAGQSLHAQILVFPHHGGTMGTSDTGANAAFAELLVGQVQPNVVAFSIGRGQYGTPRPEITEKVLAAAPGVRIACTQLSKHCSELDPKDTPDHLLPVFSAGRVGNRCCAGTMIVPLQRSSAVAPARDVHTRFITRAAPTALCMLAQSPTPKAASTS